MTNETGESETSLTIRRPVAAMPEEVFRAWTDPAELTRWFWPARLKARYEVDLRVGGQYRFSTSQMPDGGSMAVSGIFSRVDAPHRLGYTWEWEGSDEGETGVTVEIHERGAGSEVVLTHEGFTGPAERNNHIQGWKDCLDRLVEWGHSGERTSPSGVW